MSQKARAPATITMLIDLSVEKKAIETFPENIKTHFPAIHESLVECVKRKDRFFGFVIVPGDQPRSWSGASSTMDTAGLLIHDLCAHASQFGLTSQWIVKSNSKTKKALMPIINAAARAAAGEVPA